LLRPLQKRPEEWEKALREQEEWIGLDSEKKRAIGILELFLDVVPSAK